MKLLTLAALVLLSGNLFAISPSYFKKVVIRYQNGTAPTQADLEGIWTGREYRASNPNEAIGEYLGCIAYSSGPLHGPIFEEEFFGCYNDGFYQSPPSIVDEATYADLFEMVTRRINGITYPAMTFTPTEPATTFPGPTWDGNVTECPVVTFFYVVRTTINDVTSIVRAGYFYRKVEAPAGSGNSL